MNEKRFRIVYPQQNSRGFIRGKREATHSHTCECVAAECRYPNRSDE